MTEPVLTNLTRKSLITPKMGFNQMRNALYWLQRIMKQFDLSEEEIFHRLKSMGANIGATFFQELSPNSSNLPNLVKELYKITLNSKVSVLQNENKLYVEDKNCALCKYKYEDIQIPGCNISVGMIQEILERSGYKVISGEVIESKALGNKSCIHEFQIEQEVKSSG
ncbi:MAG: hypothetical protein ACTSWC_06125 [Promethearchaeota archaeon]